MRIASNNNTIVIKHFRNVKQIFRKLKILRVKKYEYCEVQEVN